MLLYDIRHEINVWITMFEVSARARIKAYVAVEPQSHMFLSVVWASGFEVYLKWSMKKKSARV